MLYHLLTPLGKHFLVFNLFNYLSFRAAGAVVTALLLAFLVGPAIIRRLRERKIGQVIRAEGPASHQGKRGTPTMGGLIIVLATVVPTLLWAPLDNRFILVAVFATLWMGAIGFLDDYLKVVKKRPKGMIGRVKMIGQVGFGILLGSILLVSQGDGLLTKTSVPFLKNLLIDWRLGEVDGLPAGATPTLPGEANLPRRYLGAGALTWRFSEFALARAYGDFRLDDKASASWSAFLQIEAAIGAHGAHKY